MMIFQPFFLIKKNESNKINLATLWNGAIIFIIMNKFTLWEEKGVSEAIGYIGSWTSATGYIGSLITPWHNAAGNVVPPKLDNRRPDSRKLNSIFLLFFFTPPFGNIFFSFFSQIAYFICTTTGNA